MPHCILVKLNSMLLSLHDLSPIFVCLIILFLFCVCSFFHWCLPKFYSFLGPIYMPWISWFLQAEDMSPFSEPHNTIDEFLLSILSSPTLLQLLVYRHFSTSGLFWLSLHVFLQKYLGMFITCHTMYKAQGIKQPAREDVVLPWSELSVKWEKHKK